MARRIFRSIGIFRKVGFEVEPYPVDWRRAPLQASRRFCVPLVLDFETGLSAKPSTANANSRICRRKVRPANICALGISAQLARFRKCRKRGLLAPRSLQHPAPASVALARMAENPE